MLLFSALLKEERWLYGVDVTCSRFLSRPEVLRAAHFAAEAHAGQVRGLQCEGVLALVLRDGY